MRMLLQLPLRQTQGFIQSLLGLRFMQQRPVELSKRTGFVLNFLTDINLFYCTMRRVL